MKNIEELVNEAATKSNSRFDNNISESMLAFLSAFYVVVSEQKTQEFKNIVVSMQQDLVQMNIDSFNDGVNAAKEATIEAVIQGILKEREECAELCTKIGKEDGTIYAAVIRARS